MTAMEILKEIVAKKTHCKHGHMMTPRNVYRRANGVANCRTCTRASKITFRKRATR